MSGNWLALAAIAGPHGVRGQVKIKSFAEPPASFADYPLEDESGARVKLRVTGEAKGMFIASIDGVTDRNAAERLKGRKLGVARTALPPLTKEGTFYVADLVGMKVVDADGAPLGTVAGVHNYGAGDILEIGAELYAFTTATFPVIDTASRIITMHKPEILGAREDEEGAA